MEWGIKQLQAFLDAFLAQPEGTSYRHVDEPYAAFLKATASTAGKLAKQRVQWPHPAYTFMLVLLGKWYNPAWQHTLSSLVAQTYSRFSITQNPSPPQGDYILYLWPGDVLSPDALYRFATAASKGADLIYCGEDILCTNRPYGRYESFFKSAPSHITALSYDALSCGVAVERNLFRLEGPILGSSAGL